MKLTKITSRNGQSLRIATQTWEILKIAMQDYNADCAGMAEAGECLNSDFEDYIDFAALEDAIRESGSKNDSIKHIEAVKNFFSL